jgi:Sigma 54 modulation/S30EA ribosomal protein C terminus
VRTVSDVGIARGGGHAVGELQISVPERLGADAARYATRKIRSLGRYAPEAVLHGRIRLTVHVDPAVHNPVIAQGNLDLNGRLVRGQVAAGTAYQAVDALHDTLRQRLIGMARNWEARRGGQPLPEPHEWRHASVPAHRPDYFPRPPGERKVVRHKTFELPDSTVDEAADDMELMDYDFQLFREAGSGQDSVLYWAGDQLRLAQVHPQPERVRRGRLPVEISPQPAARLRMADAVRRLDLSGQPFLFFVDTATNAAGLLYHRYDGHYGLITPAD